MKSLLYILICLCSSFCGVALAQAQEKMQNIQLTENKPVVPQEQMDHQIEARLNKILIVTGWYPDLKVEVREGVAFLKGKVNSSDRKTWVTDLIKKTEGIVATVDQTDDAIAGREILEPASKEARSIFAGIGKQVPYILSGLIVLAVFVTLSYLVHRLISLGVRNPNRNVLLIRTIANLAGFVIFILGLYFALNASGLSTLAISLLGGTGMLGLGLGLALKSTFENYTSSLMISLRELLKIGEVVRIGDAEGVVQSVTTRGTTLMDYEGNSVIIPNAQVFNSVIRNLTRNPNTRTDFSVGIAYNESIEQAREVIMGVFKESMPDPVLDEPAPFVVVDNLAAATVTLKVFFWFDAVKSSRVKLRSMLLQKSKEALAAAKITVPGDGREVTFLTPLKIETLTEAAAQKEAQRLEQAVNLKSTNEDHDTASEIPEIKEQAKQMPEAESGTKVL